MTTLNKRSLLVAGGLSLFAFGNPFTPSLAADAQSADGSIKITGIWARVTPTAAKTAGGYLKITNTGTQADRLTGGTLVTAGNVEIHEMSMTDGVMKMAPLDKGLEIKPGATVELKPGGYHVMFIGLKSPIKKGDAIEGTLVFERAGTIKVTYDAAEAGAKDAGHKTH